MPVNCLQRLRHLGHQRRAADQHDRVEVARFELGLIQHQLGRVERALQQVGRQLLELLARDRHRQRLALEAAVDTRLALRRERDLGLIAIEAAAFARRPAKAAGSR